MSNKIYLEIPFNKKDEVKADVINAGYSRIKFDFNGKRKWYWEGEHLPSLLEPYLGNTHSLTVSDKKMATYSDEQQAVIDAAVGESGMIQVQACAGSGKTRTIVGVARAKDKQKKRGHVFYFGRDNASEGRSKLPHRCTCSTFHAAAFLWLNNAFKNRITRVLPSHYLTLPLFNKLPTATDNELKNTVEILIIDALLAIDEFCKSDDKELTPEHLAISKEKKHSKLDPFILKIAQHIWRQQTDIESDSAISHATYLKMYALSEPQMDIDYLMVDEFQDTSPVNLGIIRSIVNSSHCQLIVVGDKNQSIFQFTGAVDAFNYIKADRSFSLTRSFRNGQKIVDLAAAVLNTFRCDQKKHHPVVFTGLDNGATLKKLDNPAAYISRTNAILIKRTMDEVQNNRKVFIASGADKLYKLIEDCEKLQNNQSVINSELSGFKNWQALVDYTHKKIGADLKPMVDMVKKYGIPTLLEIFSKIRYTRRSSADIILTTAHKSKGLEFSSVKLANDFSFDKRRNHHSKIKDCYSTQRLNLLYVAITRTLGDLDILELPFYFNTNE